MKRNDVMGFAATAVLAVACLVAGTFLVRELRPLTENGVRTQARVGEIERGARNSRWPVYEFTTESGAEIRARDINQLMFAPIEAGDSLPVLYDRHDPMVVTADIGLWIWRGPIVFFTGAALFVVLGAAIWRHGRRAE